MAGSSPLLHSAQMSALRTKQTLGFSPLLMQHLIEIAAMIVWYRSILRQSSRSNWSTALDLKLILRSKLLPIHSHSNFSICRACIGVATGRS